MPEYPSELRHSTISDRWVLIAPGRAKRPDAPGGQNHANAKHRDPFDPQNIPPADITDTLAGSDMAFATKADWDVLAMKNAFPFLHPGEKPDVTGNIRSGYGYHELVIHSPDEDKNFEDFSTAQTALVFKLYQQRLRELAKDKRIQYVQIFTNRGAEAGASVLHPHSQIVALPVVPGGVKELLAAAEQYHAKHGTDVVEDQVAREIETKDRLVAQNEQFVAYCPFAPRTTHHIRIVPRQAGPMFRDMADDCFAPLAEIINAIHRAMNQVAELPPYNVFIRSAPTHMVPTGFRWHIDVLPHMAIPGGFEISTGLDVVTVTPEDSAKLLRDAIG